MSSSLLVVFTITSIQLLTSLYQLWWQDTINIFGKAYTKYWNPQPIKSITQSLSRFTCTSTTFQTVCKLINWTYPTTANAKMRPAMLSDILDQCCLLFPSQPLRYVHVKCLSFSQTIRSKSHYTFASWWLWWKLLLIANMTIPIQQASSCGKVCSPIVGTSNSRQQILAIGLDQELSHPIFAYDESRRLSFKVYFQ